MLDGLIHFRRKTTMELLLGIAVVSYARIYALFTIILTYDGFVKRL